MINRMSMTNYRAFEHASMQIRPITVVLGPNNSGKSALVSALVALSQTVRSPDPEIPLLLQGPLLDLGTYGDVVYKHHRGRRISFDILFGLDDRPYRRRPTQMPLVGMAGEMAKVEPEFHLHVKFLYRTQRREVVVENLSMTMGDGRPLLEASYSKDAQQLMIDTVKGVATEGDRGRERLYTEHFLPAPLPSRGGRGAAEDDTMRLISYASRYLGRLLHGVEFVGPFRQPPSRTYLFSGESPSSVGPTGEKTVDVLAADASRRGERKLAIAERVSRWMEAAGIGSSVSLSTLTDRHFELKIANLVTGESENIADAGYGCSQVLPVLVGGYGAVERSSLHHPLFVVQQPEIHLHPQAQAELGTFFLELADEGCWSLVETHSEHLVVRLQSYVADPSVPLLATDVAIYYVYASKDGQKRVKHMPMDETGTFTEEWPHGFFPQRLDEARRLARMRLLRENQ